MCKRYLLIYYTIITMNIDRIITESINNFLNENFFGEDERKKHKIRKKARKGKGGIRKDYDVEDEKKYNANVDDQEQGSVVDALDNGFINVKKVAEKLYPDHTPEGAQSQLRKKLKGERSDSGSKYKLKKKEVKRLRHIIATFLGK